MKLKTYRRSRRYYKTARSAWEDIHRNTGIRPARVKETRHNAQAWVFVVK